jgi:hypothetical protein
MLHLPTERLAALADDEPSAAEAEHLASCAACTRERSAHASIVQMAAGERARLAPPLTQWHAVAAQLRAEKIIVSPRAVRAPLATRWWMRAAAAVMLVAGGIAVGRVSAGEPVVPWGSAVAAGESLDVPASFATRDDALDALYRADSAYQQALQYLAELDAANLPQRPAALRERLAALDEVASTTVRALNETPYDPVLNSYYLSTLGAREVTLRQLDAALPEGARLTSF